MLFRIPALITFLYPQLTWRILTKQKNIYLTFDDGPIPGPTNFVLSTLKKYNAKATFFCMGKNVVEHATLFKQITEEGHQVGNHTYNHLEGWHHSSQAYFEDIQKCQAVMQNAILFRPPYGKITRKQIKMLNTHQIIMWDVLTFDFLRLMSPTRCLKGSIKATRPGSIVAFHDSHRAAKNVRFILPRYLHHFKEKGFSFKAIPNAYRIDKKNLQNIKNSNDEKG